MKCLQATVIALLLFLVPGLKTQDKSPRAYFDELKSTGAFVHTATTVEGEKISAPNFGYVCFAESSPMADSNGLFLTFDARAYDKYYAQAQATIASDATLEEKKKALATIETIRGRQPYVELIPDEIMPLFPPKAADFFRKGGEELDLNFYFHGVKDVTETLYRFEITDKWKNENGKMDFAVESSTMRFLLAAKGDKPLVLNGRCEKIDKDKP
jgi:hypothetical protein